MLEDLRKLQYKIQTLENQNIIVGNKITELENQQQEYDNRLSFVLEGRQYYKKAIDLIYERSVQELQDLLNSALSYIFDDRDYKINIILSDKRGKSLTLEILDDGKPVSLKKGTGMGVKCAVSAILHIYYLQCKNSKILMLDEAYHVVSKKYLSRFFSFLSQLCDKLDFTIIMITNDPRFLEYGNKTYIISNGKIVNE